MEKSRALTRPDSSANFALMSDEKSRTHPHFTVTRL
jgi:hypothetical protein